MPISPDDIKAFHQRGFHIVKGMHSEETLRPIRSATDELIALAEVNNKDVFTRHYLRHRPDQGVLYDLYQRFPVFAALARSPQLVDALRAIYARNFFLYENSLVYKPSGRDNAVPWHQDFMSRPREPRKIIAWMPMDRVTEENGCMYAIPGSHVDGYRPWFRVRGQTHHTRIRPEYVDTEGAVPLEMEAGDVLLFDCCLLHSSRAVHSPAPRRAYRAAYQTFESSEVPRGAPIVISLEDPTSLLQVHDYEPSRAKWLIHRIGKRLAEW